MANDSFDDLKDKIRQLEEEKNALLDFIEETESKSDIA